jgi:heme exporter protein D
MGPLTLALFIVLALGAGAAFVWGTPILGIPLLLIALAVGMAASFLARARRSGDIHDELERSKEQKTEFTERDRQTLAH